jgi:hypothetical protein
MTECQVLEWEHDVDQSAHRDTGKKETPRTKARDKAWEKGILDDAIHESVSRHPQADGCWTQAQSA